MCFKLGYTVLLNRLHRKHNMSAMRCVLWCALLKGFESFNGTDGSTSIRISDARVKPSSTSRNPAVQEEKGGSRSKVIPVPALFQAAEKGNWTLDQWIAASSSGSDLRKWRVLLSWPFQEEAGVLRFNRAGDGLYGGTSVGRCVAVLMVTI